MKTPFLLAFLLFQALAPRLETGAVSGRLQGVNDTPAAGVRVAAMVVPEGGNATAGSLVSIAETDKQGAYRLDNIPPGRYYITAGLVETPNYYPGVATPATARVVEVLAGKVIENLNFSMAVSAGYVVRGRLAVQTHIPINGATLALENGLQRMTALSPDGSFEFRNVPSGQHALQVPGFPSRNIAIANRDVTGINLGSGPGVSVYGRLTNPLVQPGALALMVTLSGGPIGYFMLANNTGEFEFLEVPPGNYTVRVQTPLTPVTLPLVVANTAIDGLNVPIPFQTEVNARVVGSDGKPFTATAQGYLGITAVADNGTLNSGTRPDGSILMRLPEGTFQIGVRGLPFGYNVQSIAAGPVDLMKQPLKIVAGQTVGEIVVTIAAVPQETVKGARYSGRIVGFPAGGVPGAKVTLDTGGFGERRLETTPNADGTFEFGKVPSGTYRLNISGVQNADPIVFRPFERVEIGTTDIVGIEIPLNIRTTVTGRITVVDRMGRERADLLPGAMVILRQGDRGTSTTAANDGTFRTQVNVGEYRMDFDRLSPQYTIQSITAGSVDLLKNPLEVRPNSALPEIQIRLEFKP